MHAGAFGHERIGIGGQPGQEARWHVMARRSIRLLANSQSFLILLLAFSHGILKMYPYP